MAPPTARADFNQLFLNGLYARRLPSVHFRSFMGAATTPSNTSFNRPGGACPAEGHTAQSLTKLLNFRLQYRFACPFLVITA